FGALFFGLNWLFFCFLFCWLLFSWFLFCFSFFGGRRCFFFNFCFLNYGYFFLRLGLRKFYFHLIFFSSFIPLYHFFQVAAIPPFKIDIRVNLFKVFFNRSIVPGVRQ